MMSSEVGGQGFSLRVDLIEAFIIFPIFQMQKNLVMRKLVEYLQSQQFYPIL